MEITQKFITENRCYKQGRIIKPVGVMVHSMGVAQENPNVFFNTWNKEACSVAPHAIVHKDGILQTLPFNFRGWHAGGKANNTHISFEICEPNGHKYNSGRMLNYDPVKNQAYFENVYNRAVELTAYLCKLYDINPLEDGAVICHCEGYERGVASNHSDIMQWFPYHNKNMNTFRNEVYKLMNEKIYNSIEDLPEWAKVPIQWCIDNKILTGDGKSLGLSYESVRALTWIYRSKKYYED